MPTSNDAAISTPENAVQHLDVLVIGAGISGVGGAFHLKTQCPERSFAVLDDQSSLGGTWWTHRYPGIRSDSDLFTFGFRFKPWQGVPVASGAEILKYLHEVVEENNLAGHIRYGHKVNSASWSSEAARWTVKGVRTDSNEPFELSASFLWMGQGYYRHDQGYIPQWPGMENYQGRLIHSQEWPEDLEYEGKRVLVIGSGATAATLIPALAGKCAHVTMLQRSPTYFRAAPNSNELATMLRDLEIPDDWVHEIVRRKTIKDHKAVIKKAFENPEAMRKELIDGVLAQVGSQEVVDQHFTPKYFPFRQRVAYVPDGDLFAAIREGHASVVTDEILHFEEDGVRTKSGELIEADLVIAATGLDLLVMGGIEFSVDGESVDFSRKVMYRGAMFTGVPNMLWVFGYFRSSWTLRVDLLGDLFCRLLKHMDEKGVSQVTPLVGAKDAGMKLLPWVEDSNFNPNYLKRALNRLPLQGDRAPWRHTQDYWLDAEELPAVDLDEGALVYGRVSKSDIVESNFDCQLTAPAEEA